MTTLAKLTLVLSVSILPLVPATSQAHDSFRWDPPGRYHHFRHGVRITSVAFRSPAAFAGLECGDVILEVDGRDIHNYEQLHTSLHRTGYRTALTVRDAHTGRVRVVQVFPHHGHIGITVTPTNR